MKSLIADEPGDKSKEKRSILFWPIFQIYIAIIIIFILDLLIPTGWGVWILYLIPITAASWNTKKVTVFSLIVFVSCIFIILDLIFGAKGITGTIAIVNRLTGIMAIIIVSYFVFQRNKTTYDLKMQKVQFNNAVKYNPLPIMLRADDGEVLLINEAWSERTGYTKKDIKTIDDWVRLAYGENNETILKTLRETSLQNGRSRAGEFLVRTKSGDKRVWEFYTAHLGELSDGRKVTISIADDITEKKQTEDKLKELSKRLYETFDKTAVGIAHVSKTGQILWCNKKYSQMMGYDYNQLYSMTAFDLTHPDDILMTQKENEKMWNKENEYYYLEKRYVRKDGSVFWASVTASRIDEGDSGKDFSIAVVQDIDERKKVEIELHESEERFRRSFESAPVGIVHILPDGHWLRINEKYREIMGYSSEELENMTYLDLTYPDDLQADMEKRNKLLSGEISSFKLEKRYLRKDGKVIWTVLNCTMMTEPSKNLRYMVSVIEDVTQRKYAEEERERLLDELDRQQAWLNTIIQQMPSGIAIAEVPTGKIIYHNEEAARILSHPKIDAADVGDYGNYGALHPDLTPFKSEEYPIARAIKGETVRQEEMLYRRGDATIASLLVNASPAINNEGKTIAVICTFNDITERKMAEKALEEREAILRSFYSSSSFMMGIAEDWGEDILHVYDNPTTCRFFNVKPDSTKDQFASNLGLSRYIIELWLSNYRLSLREMRPVTFEYFHDNHMERWLSVTVAYIGQGFSGHKRFSYLAEDITERREAMKKLETTMGELKRSNQELERFAYIASHDLQEPVRMVKSFAQLLEKYKDKQLDDKAMSYLNYISEGAGRMQQLIADLLQYSRLTTQAKAFEPVECNELIKEVLVDLKFKIEEEKAVINFSRLPVVYGDRTQLRQLFQNLIHNSLKFRSERAPEISIKCEKRKDQWLFSVRDNGIGIESEYFDRIFVIFQRLHERDKYPGTGIGLAVCKKIVERHGGNVCVDSEPGKGTTFYFTLTA
ncbi:MAG: PAS domain S-box protein [Clostridiales bacterium]